MSSLKPKILNKPLKSLKNYNSLIILFFIFLLTALFTPVAESAAKEERQTAEVAEILTGDSIRLAGGKVLRYAGIAAPALQSRIPLVRQYGEKSKKFNEELLSGKKILIEWGPQLRNNQNELLGYCFLPDGKFINGEILKEGHAKLRLLAPNIQYAAMMREFEYSARRFQKGIWKEEPKNPYLESTTYIGEKNTKLYYFPTSPELEKMPQGNLVTFRSRVEATAAGYRACPTCKESNRDVEY